MKQENDFLTQVLSLETAADHQTVLRRHSPMVVFSTHYDMNTFSLAEGSLDPRFLCLGRQENRVSSVSSFTQSPSWSEVMCARGAEGRGVLDRFRGLARMFQGCRGDPHSRKRLHCTIHLRPGFATSNSLPDVLATPMVIFNWKDITT